MSSTQTKPTKPTKPTPAAAIPPRRTWKWFLLAVVLNYLLFRFLIPSTAEPIAVPYTFFKQEVEKNNVKAIYTQGETITGKFSSAVTYSSKNVTDFKTIVPIFVDTGL